MTSLDRIDVITRYLLTTTSYARGKNIVKTLHKRCTILSHISFVKMHREINFASGGEEKSINST